MAHYHWTDWLQGQLSAVIHKLGKKIITNYQQGDIVSYEDNEFVSFYKDIQTTPPQLVGQVVKIKKNKKDIVGRPFYETTIKVIKSEGNKFDGSLITEPCQMFKKIS